MPEHGAMTLFKQFGPLWLDYKFLEILPPCARSVGGGHSSQWEGEPAPHPAESSLPETHCTAVRIGTADICTLESPSQRLLEYSASPSENEKTPEPQIIQRSVPRKYGMVAISTLSFSLSLTASWSSTCSFSNSAMRLLANSWLCSNSALRLSNCRGKHYRH